MTVEIGWERKLVTGSPGGKKTTTLLAAVNDNLDVPTSERLSLSRGRRYECTRIVVSETLRVMISSQENFKAGALRQRVGK